MTISWLTQNVPSFIPPKAWPPSSPDLNIMDNLWGIVKPLVDAHTPSTLKELKRAIKVEWGKIPLVQIHNLVDSMAERLSEVVHRKGGMTLY